MLALFDLGQARAQHVFAVFEVLEVAALHLGRDHDARGLVDQTDGRGGLVDLLSAGARGAVDLHLDILVAQLDLAVVGDLGHDLDRGEGGVAASGGVERGDAHQTVDAVLALEEAVGVLALDHDGRALQPGLVAVEIVHQLDLVAVALGPHIIHAVEHRGPVLRLGAAGTGVEGQNGVVRVVLAGQQRAEAHALGLFRKVGVLVLQLFEQRIVVLLHGHIDEGHHVVPAGAELLIALDLTFELFEPLLNLLGLLHVVPEAVTLAGCLQLFDLLLGRFEVQRAAQHLQRGLRRIQFALVFFKFKHVLSCLLIKLQPSNVTIIYKKLWLVNLFFYLVFLPKIRSYLFSSCILCAILDSVIWKLAALCAVGI